MNRIISKEEHHIRNKAICSWLEKHYHIKKKTVAEEAGFPKPDLIYEAMAGREKIPKKYLRAVEDILKDYGFKSVTYRR